jgi:hypothetical protein
VLYYKFSFIYCMDIDLDELFSDPNYGFTTGRRFYNNLVAAGIVEEGSDPKPFIDYVNGLKTTQVHSERKQQYKKIKADYVNQQWQSDLIDVSNMSQNNKGYKWIMTVIDIYSRKAYAQMIYRKQPEYTLECIKEVVKLWGKPEQIQTDDGNEYEAEFKQYLKKHNIRQKKVKGDGHYSQGVIERFNRTLIGYIKKYMTRMHNKKIIGAIPAFIKQYNSTKHSTMGATPNEIFDGKIEPKNLSLNLKDSVTDVVTSFNIGDVVRVRKESNIFTKGRAEKYSTSKFKIVDRIGNRYTLSNGSEYSYNQLQLVGGDEEESKPLINEEAERKERKIKKVFKELETYNKVGKNELRRSSRLK